MVNTTTWSITISDITAPAIENVSYLPNTTRDLDPGVMVNVTAFVRDNVSVGTVLLQYKLNTSSDWTGALMTPITSTMYSGNFTPTIGNWSFRIYANDTSSNINYSAIINVSIGLDYAWINVTSIQTTKVIVQTEQRELQLGNITLNNTGDFDLNFTITSNSTWILFNRTNTSFYLGIAPAGNITTFNITANTTGFAVGTYTYGITINAYAQGSTLISSQSLNGTVVIQNVAGPFFSVTITNYDATVAQGDAGVVLTATLSNLGTSEATNTWFNWSLPSGWTNVSGIAENFVGFLGVGSKAVNNITISVGTSSLTGAQTIIATAGSSSDASGSDSKSVNVNSLTPTSSGSSSSSSGSVTGTASTKEATKEQKALLLQTSEELELLRGFNGTFMIKVTNPFKNSVMKNVTLAVQGFLAQYIQIAPDKITEINYNGTGEFEVTITAPTYLTKGNHPLNFTITGRLVEGASERNIIEQRLVTLSVHEVSRSEAGSILEEATKDYQDMVNAGFPAATIKKLLDQAENTFKEKDYEKVNEITGMILLTRNAAFNTKDLIQEIMNSIKIAENNGLRVDETKNLLNLALAAFEREDYASA
ncbi:MAG: hypothetical protein HYT71_03795, partial [Candidatus Aenigmarchaeota archaeon]|nr:hypothetical protein [Candidatus Aenigmarchaeota archaeon]